MQIGILLYSQTGNTLAVAEKIRETCVAAGHIAEIRQITVEGREKADAPVVLKDIPGTDGCDVIVFGSPVQAFSLCQPMALYVKQMKSLKGIPVGCFFTQGLPKAWMGGNRACKQLRTLCLKKGADPVRLGHIHWNVAQRDEQIADLVSATLKFVATAAPQKS